MSAPVPFSHPVHRARFLLLGLIVLVGTILRLNQLNRSGLWFDEFCSLTTANGWGQQFAVSPGWGIVPDEPKYAQWSAARPLGDVMPALAASDDHPPLYFLLLRGWEAMFGDTAVAVRLPSVAVSLVAIVLLYGAARERLDAATALWACAIMAVAGPQIEFAQQARHYIFLMTLSLAMMWMLLRIERLGATYRRAIGLCAIALAAMLTHYLAAPVVFAVGLYAVVDLRGRRRLFVLAAIAVAGGMFAALWGPMLLRQGPTMAASHQWMIDNHPGRLWRLSRAFVELPLRFLIEPDFSALSNRLLLAGGCLWFFIPAALWRRELRLWAICLLSVIGLIAISDLVQHTGQLSLIRFTLAATPAAYLLMAALPRGRWRWVPPAAAVLLAVTNVSLAYDPPWRNDLRPAALLLDEQLQNDDGLVFVSGDGNARALAQWVHQYENFLTHRPRVIVLLHDPADAATLAQLRTCRRVWVAWPMQNRGVNNVLPGFEMLSSRNLPPAMVLYQGRIDAEPR